MQTCNQIMERDQNSTQRNEIVQQQSVVIKFSLNPLRDIVLAVAL